MQSSRPERGADDGPCGDVVTEKTGWQSRYGEAIAVWRQRLGCAYVRLGCSHAPERRLGIVTGKRQHAVGAPLPAVMDRCRKHKLAMCSVTVGRGIVCIATSDVSGFFCVLWSSRSNANVDPVRAPRHRNDEGKIRNFGRSTSRCICAGG